MWESRKKKVNFQEQLQSKLNQLTNRKHNITSSHKKIHKVIPLQIQQYSKITTQKQQHQQPSQSQSSSQPQPMQVFREVKRKQMNSTSIFSMVNDKQLQQFLKQNFNHKLTQLRVDEFVNRMIQVNGSTLKEQIRQMICKQLAQQITTTNPNVISLNALEIVIRKKQHNITSYFYQKMCKNKYELKKKQYKSEYQMKERKLQDIQVQYQQKLQQLKATQARLREKEQNISKREKKISIKEKEVHQRYKNSKKILEDTAHKLYEDYNNKIGQIINKYDKKVNGFERNLKYKLQGLDRKVNQIHRLREIKEGDIKANIMHRIEQNKREQQQVRKRKHEKEKKEWMAIKQQYGNAEEQNNKLLKMCTSLENKVAKLQKKNKKMEEQMDGYTHKIRECEFACQQKDIAFEQVHGKLIRLQKSNKSKIQVNRVVQVYENALTKQYNVHQIQQCTQLVNGLLYDKCRCSRLIQTVICSICSNVIELQQQSQNNILSETNVDVRKYFQSLSSCKVISIKKINKLITDPQLKAKLIILYMIVCEKQKVQQYMRVLIQIGQQESVQTIAQLMITNRVPIVVLWKIYNKQIQQIQYIRELTDIILVYNTVSDQHNSSIFLTTNAYSVIIKELLILGINKDQEVETIQKLSIIIQRIMYHHAKSLIFGSQWKEMMRQVMVNYSHNSSIIVPNLQNILSMINQY